MIIEKELVFNYLKLSIIAAINEIQIYYKCLVDY